MCVGAVRELLIDGKSARQHYAHVVGPMEHLFCFERPMEVAGLVEQPRILRANFGPDKADALFPIPVHSPMSPSPHFRFDLYRLIVGFRDAAGDIAPVAVASFGEDCRVALQHRVLCVAGGSSSHTSSDNEVAHRLRGPARGDVRQNLVEEIQICTSALVGDHAAILPEYLEFEVAHTRLHHKRGLPCGRRQLPHKKKRVRGHAPPEVQASI